MLDKGQIKDWDGEPEKKVEKLSGQVEALEENFRESIRIRNTHYEALPTGERVTLSPEEAAARRKRSRWIALALGGFVLLVFVLTMAKVGGGAGVPEVYRIPTSSSQ